LRQVIFIPHNNTCGAFHCGRASPEPTKRFSNPTTTLFQYWAVMPDIVVPIFSGKLALSPTYIGFCESDIPAISLRFSEAKSLSDIKFICQIFFRAKCFSKFNVSQVLTKASPMDYSQYIWNLKTPHFNIFLYHNYFHEKQNCITWLCATKE
jgi:hypothetical protein